MKDNSVKYAIKQGVVSAVPTLVLLVILGFVMTKTAMSVSAAAADFPITMFLTALICTIVQSFVTKGPVKKGMVPEIVPVEKQAAYALIPKSIPAFVILISVAATVLFACAPVGLFQIVAPNAEIPRIPYIILKAVIVAITAGYVTYHANMFICSIFQERL